MRRALAALTLSAFAVVGGGHAASAVGATTPAAARAAVARDEIFPRPAGSTFTFAGHGLGHGIGMSQYGAYGAARKGLTWPRILEGYYPGTTRVWQGNPRLKVRLTALGSGSLTVISAPGLRFTDGVHTVTLPTSAEQYRVVPERGGITLQWRVGGAWTSSTGWRAWTSSAFGFSNPTTKTVRTVLPSGIRRDYRDTVRAWPSGSGVVSVNDVSTEAYLWSVIPAEMPPSWSVEALRAQAVAARTYASYGRVTTTTTRYDTCDSTSCQVYKGVGDHSSSGSRLSAWEHPAATAAVSATAGVVLTSSGRPALTMFSASNGGWTVKGSMSYLPSAADPYDGAAATFPHSWSASVAVTSVEKSFPTVGTVRSIDVVSRDGNGDWGGRTQTVRVVGSAGSSTVSAETFKARLGLRSVWWTITS